MSGQTESGVAGIKKWLSKVVKNIASNCNGINILFLVQDLLEFKFRRSLRIADERFFAA